MKYGTSTPCEKVTFQWRPKRQRGVSGEPRDHIVQRSRGGPQSGMWTMQKEGKDAIVYKGRQRGSGEESDLTGRRAVFNLYSERNEKLLQNFEQGKDNLIYTLGRSLPAA